MSIAAASSPLLAIENVSKRFQSSSGVITALENVSLSLDANEFVGIVGRSGCGKSTLLRLIGGLEPEFDGRIRFEGRDVKAPGLDRGIVFQEHRLFPLADDRPERGDRRA